jgi:hypothetical protein
MATSGKPLVPGVLDNPDLLYFAKTCLQSNFEPKAAISPIHRRLRAAPCRPNDNAALRYLGCAGKYPGLGIPSDGDYRAGG